MNILSVNNLSNIYGDEKDPVGPGDNDLGILCQPDHGFHGQWIGDIQQSL